MAKRYIRLNWQDRPSVATPINQINLNKMDKGIDDIDNAVEDLYTTKLSTANIANNDVTTAAGLAWDARRGKAIRDDVNALTNNLNGVSFVRGQTNTVVTSTNAFYITLGVGRYAIELVTGTSMSNAIASYLVYRHSNSASLSPVIEGTHDLAPRCIATENGIAILLKTGEEARNVYYCIKIF